MNSKKEEVYRWLFSQWKPLILKTLKQNDIVGLDREDLLQEISLVLWECFAKGEVKNFSSYLSRSIHNRVTDLYADSQRYYFPSTRLRCLGCGIAVTQKPRKCPSCEGTRWRVAKGKMVLPLTEEIPYEDSGVIIEEYPKEIKGIIDSILDGRKTGIHQKEKVREYLINGWN